MQSTISSSQKRNSFCFSAQSHSPKTMMSSLKVIEKATKKTKKWTEADNINSICYFINAVIPIKVDALQFTLHYQ
jgi:hypothetical protein